MAEHAYESPAQSPSAIVRDAVIEQEAGRAFAVAAVLKFTDIDGRTMLRFECVRREPFEASLRSWSLEPSPSWSDESGLDLVLETSAGHLRIRAVRDDDARWLSAYGSVPLPGGAAGRLVRVLHEVEAEPGPTGAWEPFDDASDEPIEFLVAFVSARTGGVFGLAYTAALSDEHDYHRDQFLSWRLGGRWTPAPGTWPTGSRRWIREAPGPGIVDEGFGHEWWTRRIHPACAQRFLAAFDTGQWLSDDSALAASIGPDDDCDVGDFSTGLRERFARHRESLSLRGDDALIAFMEGRAMLLRGDTLGDLLLIDANADPERVDVAASHWVATVELGNGAGGARGGGPWRLEVLRIDGGERRSHWWLMESDAADEVTRGTGRLTMFRDAEGRPCRVVLRDERPFGEAIEEFGLDGNAFGSPTLWGMPVDLGHAGSQGWVWTFGEVEEPFPFASPASG